jgi:hypothetical protein
VLTVAAPEAPDRTPRRGCTCVLFITEESGTQRGTYARCLDHKRIARQNHAAD